MNSKKYNHLGIAKIVTIFSLCLFLLACQDNKDTSNSGNFDRKIMLQNYADNFIKPAFIDLQAKTNGLQTSITTFTQTPNLQNLANLQGAWQLAYFAFQSSNAYNFGAAGEDGIRKTLVEEIATFPVSSEKIEANIKNNANSLMDFSRDNRGFLAIEYLVFDLQNDNNKILNNFAQQNRKNYLIALATKLKTQVDAVVESWNGTYRTEFINNAGKEAGSSTAIFYNEFVKSYETLKNFKVGLPLGKRAGQTKTEPEKFEAYYSGKSLKMLREHFSNIENIWYGKNKNAVQGLGLKQYLESVEGGKTLVNSTELQIAQVKKILALLPENPPLSQQLDNNNLNDLNTELQKLTRFFKSDMSSLLGISISFLSSDGD